MKVYSSHQTHSFYTCCPTVVIYMLSSIVNDQVVVFNLIVMLFLILRYSIFIFCDDVA